MAPADHPPSEQALSEEPTPRTEQTLNEMMSELVFQWIDSFILKSLAPPADAAQITIKPITFSPRENYEFTDGDLLPLSRTYPTLAGSIAVNFDSLREHVNAGLAPLKSSSSVKSFACTDEQVSSIQQAFVAPFVGNTNTTFRKYISDCWKTYVSGKTRYKYPYTAIVQSSGFGKSRLLKELAKITQDDERMRVLYTCVRKFDTKESFPKTTGSLKAFFFPHETTTADLVHRLFETYAYAVANWETVGEEWYDLFSKIDISVLTNIQAHTTSAKKEDPRTRNGVLIFVVDEARTLLEMEGTIEQGVLDTYFRMLRRALYLVNIGIAKAYSDDAGVFAILADTNSRISDFVPSVVLDPSSRVAHPAGFELFPPFVLTETTDVHSVCEVDADISEYRAMVMKTSVSGKELETWMDLVHMGRPLWKSMIPHDSAGNPRCSDYTIQTTIRFAASKLISGADPKLENSFCEATMFGVASILCRLGLRPYSSSPLASRAVANFMAVLCYVSYTHEHYVSSYTSDPMLAFGATHLWYARKDVFAHRILPQFRKLILQEVVDTGDIGEVVARILLLFAMDKCSRVASNLSHMMTFHSVNTFMSVLRGPDVTLDDEVQHITIEKLQKKLDTKWNHWKFGFSHFVQLVLEPTEECLWYMLSRRAAGVFPSNQKGADIFIPIFTCDEDGKNARVSMILVQVKNYGSNVKAAIKKAIPKLRPNNVFDSSNALSWKAPDEIVRVIMSLRRNSNPSRYYAFDTEEEDEQDKEDEAIQGVGVKTKGKGKRKAKPKPNPNKKGWCVLCLEGFEDGSFVPEGVTEQLNLLLAPWWDITKLVEADLATRDEDKLPYPLAADKLKKFARFPLSRFFYGEFDDDRGKSKKRKERGNDQLSEPKSKKKKHDE